MAGTDWKSLGQGVGSGFGAAGSFYSAYQQYKHRKDKGESLRSAAKLSDAQAGLYGQLAGVYSTSGKAYLGAAGTAGEIGKANAANIRKQAGMLERYKGMRLVEAAKEARQRIGAGRAAFAGNGVLVDTGAAARWEQDEAADAALEQLDIMQQFEDEGWTLLVKANQAEAEGWANAAGYAGQAAGMFGQAAGTMAQSRMASLQASEYMRQARAADRANRHAWLGSLISGVGETASSIGFLVAAF